MLLLSRGAIPVDQRLMASLERQGAEVTVLRTSDYYALIVKPEQSQVPEATVAHMSNWLAQGSPVAEARPALGPRRTPRVREARELEAAGGVVESTLACPGSHASRSGSFPATRWPVRRRWRCSCSAPERCRTPAQPGLGRAGAALGGRGHPTVRLDLPGIGEAGGNDPELVTDESTYESWRVDDVRNVLNQLQAAGISDRSCSAAGAPAPTPRYRALADPRVCGALLKPVPGDLEQRADR